MFFRCIGIILLLSGLGVFVWRVSESDSEQPVETSLAMERAPRKTSDLHEPSDVEAVWNEPNLPGRRPLTKRRQARPRRVVAQPPVSTVSQVQRSPEEVAALRDQIRDLNQQLREVSVRLREEGGPEALKQAMSDPTSEISRFRKEIHELYTQQ